MTLWIIKIHSYEPPLVVELNDLFPFRMASK